MRILKRGFIVSLLLVVALGVGVYSFYHGSSQKVRAGQVDKKQDESDMNGEEEQKDEARKKIEKMSDEEIIELINKGRKANKGKEELTKEEKDMLKAIKPEEFYSLMGMTDEEVVGYINGYHQNIDGKIMRLHKGTEDNDQRYLSGKAEFEWIKENYDFEKEYYHDSIKEILNLRDKYMNGDDDALFSLKYILYELNEEFSPETLTMDRANKLTLGNAVRIQNGKAPIDERE